MKMVRSLLLGAAAGFVAIAGAQAADLPVKAKPVQYVKICDLYGAGYYYIPGTDTCIKIGGYVRTNVMWDGRSTFLYAGPAPNAGQMAWFNRASTQDVSFRARVWITADVRSQTSMGTLRSYYLVQITSVMGAQGTVSDTTIQLDLLRAFIQFAGFTIGRSISYAEVPDLVGPPMNNIATPTGGPTGPTGVNLLGYTWTMANGVSASIGIEDPDTRSKAVVNLGGGAAPAAAAFGFFTAAGPFNSAQISNFATPSRNVPDITANLMIQQSWGQFGIVGALHNDNASYYTGIALPGAVNGAGGQPLNVACGLGFACGHPSDAWGYFLGAGLGLTQLPGLPGDILSFAGGYSVGAAGYTVGTQPSVLKGTTWTFGSAPDGVYGNGGNVELTTAYYLTAGYQHNWTPTVKTSIYGGYTNVQYNGNATALICPAGALTAAPTGTGIVFLGVPNCNPNWSYWNIGSRILSWTPVPNLDIGLDLQWLHMDGAFSGTIASPAVAIAGGNAIPAQPMAVGSNDVQSVVFSVTRSFWP